MKPLLLLPLLFAAAATAAPVTYEIDPSHTYPSFEADHMGLSVWRGKLNKSSGSIVYDKATAAGPGVHRVQTEVDAGELHLHLHAARGDKFFNVENNPSAGFKGRFEGGSGGVPARVAGELTLNGRTRPVTLTIHQLRCIPHPLHKRELCGADASGSFNREDFGLSAGKDWGFKMDVTLRIQVEAVAKE